MTESEAIKRLKYFQQNDGVKRLFSRINKDAVAETEELTALCIKALEKQISKKPDRTSRPYKCPECGSWEGVRSSGWYLPPYCCMCGTKLDWSDSND